MSDDNLNVLILDDDTSRAQDWASQLNNMGGMAANAPDSEGVKQIFKKIYERRLKGREDGNNWRAIDCDPLDDAKLLIVDYDLLGLDDSGEWTTGAEVAYAARLVSSVGPILLVNQHGTNPFDLTMRQAINSKADWDVGSDQILNPGLWTSSGFAGFRPWAWPNMRDEPLRFTRAIKFIRDNLDGSITETLGFDFEASAEGKFPSREAWAWLGLPSLDSSFRELVISDTSSRSSMHIALKDVAVLDGDDEQIARVAAAIILRWLEKVVLPNQDILADAPHLAYQMPWLLGDWDKEDSWHTLERLDGHEVLREEVAPNRFEPTCLFSRPVYWAEQIRQSDALSKPKGFDFPSVPNLVFREDVSNFGAPQESMEFPTDLPAIDNRRWISNRDKAASLDGPQDVKQVIYEPQSYLLF